MQIEDATLWWLHLLGLRDGPETDTSRALRRENFENRLQMVQDVRREDLFVVMVGLLRVTAMLWVECCQLVYMHPHILSLVSPEVEVEVEPEDEEGDHTAWMQGWQHLKRPASDMEPTDLTHLLHDEEEANREKREQEAMEEEHGVYESQQDLRAQQEAEEPRA